MGKIEQLSDSLLFQQPESLPLSLIVTGVEFLPFLIGRRIAIAGMFYQQDRCLVPGTIVIQ